MDINCNDNVHIKLPIFSKVVILQTKKKQHNAHDYGKY